MNSSLDHLKLIVSSLPEKPGVYRFFDENGKIIYVGKAKRLKRRVASYFNKEHDSAKVKLMVKKIRDIQTTVVDSEWEALLLENSMIKQFKPHYNILLKDDKSYPWLAVTKEEFPRVFFTRNPDASKMHLFGPYSSVKHLKILLDTIYGMFPLRTCRRLVKNDRPCMQYQLKKCPAPCCNKISAAQYQDNVAKIMDIIRGNRRQVIAQLKAEMMQYANRWQFEQASVLKRKIDILEKYVANSVVVSPQLTQLDVFAMEEEADCGYISFLRIVDGAIVQAHITEIDNKMDMTREELLWAGMLSMKEKLGSLFPEIIVPFMPELAPEGWNFHVPQRGEKRKLQELAERNARFYMMEKKKRQDLVNPERRSQRVLLALQNALNMKTLPKHIECFDNSNTQGDEPVGAMVCFLNGKPAKREYRHYNIKSVVGADDFATMEEVVTRRYTRLLDENKPLPDLIVIDGGKGQLHSAYKALKKLGIQDRMMLVGIAERLEDIYKVGDELPVYIDKKSEAQKLLQQLRDEVHRFGITHHRKRRSKVSIASILDGAPGIGPVLSRKLLSHFKNMAAIKAAGKEELAAVIGHGRAAALEQYLRQGHSRSNGGEEDGEA